MDEGGGHVCCPQVMRSASERASCLASGGAFRFSHLEFRVTGSGVRIQCFVSRVRTSCFSFRV